MGLGHNANPVVSSSDERGSSGGATATRRTTTDNTVANIMSAAQVQARKLPPPEKAETIQLRRLVIVSFWAVILLLGLPVWWKTTSIYRAELPLQDIASWSSGTVSSKFLRFAPEATSDHILFMESRSVRLSFPYKSGYMPPLCRVPKLGILYRSHNMPLTTSTSFQPTISACA